MRLILTSLLLLLAQSALLHGETLMMGAAKTDLTPPLGYRLSGYFHERLATGVHDPLYAKAIVLSQGEQTAAWVLCDVIGISADVARQARRLASRKTGIPAEHVLIAATHSHTGPLYFGALRNHFHRQAVLRQGADPQERLDYPEFMAEKIAEAVQRAHAARTAAGVKAGYGEENSLSFNRRFHMRDGGVRFNPGRRNPNIIRPAGPIDPQVGLLLFSDPQGSPRASLTVFALHLDTVGGTEYSADFPRYLQNKLQEQLGEPFLSMFAAGTCGDINHIDVARKAQLKGQAEAKRIGEKLGKTVLSAMSELENLDRPSLAIAAKRVTLPLQQYSRQETEQAAKEMFKVGTRELPFLAQVRAYKITALQERSGKQLDVLVQAFRLSSDVALIGLPGEVFVDLGLAIKRQSPFKYTLVVELSGDAPGYVPTKKAFAEGSYETVNSRIEPGGGERLVEAAVELLIELRSRTK